MSSKMFLVEVMAVDVGPILLRVHVVPQPQPDIRVIGPAWYEYGSVIFYNTVFIILFYTNFVYKPFFIHNFFYNGLFL